MNAPQPGGAMEACRLAAGVSLPEAAVHARVSTGTIRRYERGQTTPSQAVLFALARLYKASPADLQGQAEALAG